MAKFRVQIRILDSKGTSLGITTEQVEAETEHTAMTLAVTAAKKRRSTRDFEVIKITRI